MAPEPGAHSLKLLLLEATPGSLVAALAEPSLTLVLADFRRGVNDALTHPLDKKTLLDIWNRISARLPQGEQKTTVPQPALAKEHMPLVVRLQEKNREGDLKCSFPANQRNRNGVESWLKPL